MPRTWLACTVLNDRQLTKPWRSGHRCGTQREIRDVQLLFGPHRKHTAQIITEASQPKCEEKLGESRLDPHAGGAAQGARARL